MNDQIEATTVVLPENAIVLGPVRATVLSSLAIYGGMSLTRDVVRKAKTFNENRKARKAAKQVETPATTEQ